MVPVTRCRAAGPGRTRAGRHRPGRAPGHDLLADPGAGPGNRAAADVNSLVLLMRIPAFCGRPGRPGGEPSPRGAPLRSGAALFPGPHSSPRPPARGVARWMLATAALSRASHAVTPAPRSLPGEPGIAQAPGHQPVPARRHRGGRKAAGRRGAENANPGRDGTTTVNAPRDARRARPGRPAAGSGPGIRRTSPASPMVSGKCAREWDPLAVHDGFTVGQPVPAGPGTRPRRFSASPPAARPARTGTRPAAQPSPSAAGSRVRCSRSRKSSSRVPGQVTRTMSASVTRPAWQPPRPILHTAMGLGGQGRRFTPDGVWQVFGPFVAARSA